MSTINLTCKICGETFSKEKKEFNRQIKNGRSAHSFFCSQSCSTVNSNRSDKRKYDHLKNTRKRAPKGNFTIYLKFVRQRSIKKGLEHDLDESYLQELWDKQEGKCAYTGTPMKIRSFKNSKEIDSASLDRIDSSKWYVKGNVQFILYPLNLAKSDFSEQEFQRFMKLLNTRYSENP